MNRILATLLALCIVPSAFAVPDQWYRSNTVGMLLLHDENVDPNNYQPLSTSGTVIISNSILTMYPGTRNYPLQGISSTYVTIGNSAVSCDTPHTGTMKGQGNDMMWCDGSSWVDVTTTLDDVVVSATTLTNRLTTVSNSLLNYETIAAHNADISSLTTAVNGKVSTTTYNTGISSLTTAVNSKEPAIASGTTAQYWRGDKTWQPLPVASRTFDYTARSLNTCFRPSAAQDTLVNYSVNIGTSLSLSGGTVGTVYLRSYTDSSCTTGTQEVARYVNGNTGALTVGLALSQTATARLSGMIEAGRYIQIITENTTGTPSFTLITSQQVAF